MKPQDFKACVHCRHFNTTKEGARECRNLAASLGVSLVTARPQWARAEQMRARGNKLCGPDGKLFALPATPIRDTATAFMMGLEWRFSRAIHWPGSALARQGQRIARMRAAWAGIQDNSAAPAAKDGQPIEPLPDPDQPKPEGEGQPKPGDLPQTDGEAKPDGQPTSRALVAVDGPQTAPSGGQGAGMMATACAIILLGFLVAGIIGQDAPSVARATANPAWAPCAQAGKATCCYRMPDGSTRCFDCSTKAAWRF